MQKVLNQNWCNEYRKPFQLTMAPWQSRYEHIMEVLKRKEIYCRNVCILGTYMYIALLLQHMVIYFSGKNTKINQSTSNCNIKFSLRWVFIILNNFNLAWIQLTGIIRLPHEFLFTMKICIKSLIISLIYANGVITFDVVPTPHNPPLGRNTSLRILEPVPYRKNVPS